VFEGKLAHLALDPGPVDGDGTDCRTQRGHDSGNYSVIELDPTELGEDGLFPGFRRDASLGAPVLTRLGMELAVASVGGPSVAPDPSAADAVEQASKKIDSVMTVRTTTSALGPAE
jgi:hypothetical protein